MVYKKTYFNEGWLKCPAYYWVRPVMKDRTMAACVLCGSNGVHKQFSLSTMGAGALESHAQGSKHKKMVQAKAVADTNPMDRHVVRTVPGNGVLGASAEVPTSSSSTVAVSALASAEHAPATSACSIDQNIGATSTKPASAVVGQSAMEKYLAKEQVTKAEIMWSLFTVSDHLSQRSCGRVVELFAKMFPDSDIAQKMQLQRTKIGYYVNFGLGPYFKSELENSLKNTDEIVVGFDESLNKIAQLVQMDLHVRFWDCVKEEAASRYLTSVFLGHSSAQDLLVKFRSGVGEELLKKLLQVSMDGPNVNLKFLKLLATYRSELSPKPPLLVDIGSCGLHVLHGAFKTGMTATGWELTKLFRASHNLFKDVPARRADLIRAISKCDDDDREKQPQVGKDVDCRQQCVEEDALLPLKFCAMRWLENSPAAKRSRAVLPNFRKYVKLMEREKKEPTCNSYKVAKQMSADPLLHLKHAFFLSMCDHCEKFLREFQTDAPYVPFLYESMRNLLETFMEMFVKEDVLQENASSLNQIDLSNKENLLPAKNVVLRHTVRDAFRKVKNASPKDILSFRQDCRSALVALSKKLMERSPLKYKLTRSLSCLDPALVASKPDIAVKRLSDSLQDFVGREVITGPQADVIERKV